MKNDGTFRGNQAFGAWNNRQVTKRMERAERESDRARFNNFPAPIGTLPAKPPVMAILVGEATQAQLVA